MTDANGPTTASPPVPSTKKDGLFWGKIVSTQFLIRHTFLKSFALPMIIAQVSTSTKQDYTKPKDLLIIYTLIALHFLSGIFVSDRKFRHALGFLPHILGLGCTSYVLYSNILRQLAPWLRIRVIIHALGTMSVFCFIASLHTTSPTFRSILRRLSSYFGVFYFVLNAYVLWWSNDETKLFDHALWTILIRFHAVVYLLVSGGFCLDIFLVPSCQCALYLIGCQLFLDSCILYRHQQSNTRFWLSIDFLLDDIAMVCGYFYLYQFNVHQKIKLKKKD